MRVAVITPVRNAEGLIGDTVRSVMGQRLSESSPIDVLYVIQDGSSTDGTRLEVERALASTPSPHVSAVVRSEVDRGMYDALSKAFVQVDDAGGADWYCYLNAGDLWTPTCLETLALVDEQTDASWVCGLHTYYGPTGAIVHTRLPFRYRRDLLRAGAYGRGLPTVQQESTFWRRALQSTIDVGRLATFRTAGDAYLWWTFSAMAEPIILQASLGGFRYHGGHLGVDKDAYRREIESFAGPLSIATRALIAAQVPIWEQPARLKARFNPYLYAYSTTIGGWISHRGSITPGTHD